MFFSPQPRRFPRPRTPQRQVLPPFRMLRPVHASAVCGQEAVMRLTTSVSPEFELFRMAWRRRRESDGGRHAAPRRVQSRPACATHGLTIGSHRNGSGRLRVTYGITIRSCRTSALGWGRSLRVGGAPWEQRGQLKRAVPTGLSEPHRGREGRADAPSWR
jgi:hypothetical protein